MLWVWRGQLQADHILTTALHLVRINLTIQWNPAMTKCHDAERIVCYSGVFIIVKTPLQRNIWLTTKNICYGGVTLS